MKETGLPSPFIDIMMLSPASRTAAMSAWKRGIGGAHDRAGIARDRPSALSSSASFASSGASSWPWNSTISRLSGSPISMRVDRGAVDRDGAAEVDHGAVDQFHRLGIERHDVARRLHGAAEGGELADAQHLARLDRLQLQLERGGEGQRALRADQQPRQVVPPGGARGRGQRVDVVAADAAKLAREAGGDLVRLRGAQRAQALDQVGDAAPACRRRGCRASRPKRCRVPSARMRVDRARRCRPSARSGSTSSRRSCCRPCRRWCSAHGSRDRPGRTGRAGAARHSGAPSTSPGSTSGGARRRDRSRSTRRRCLVQSITSARFTVWPHWLVPPPRGQHGHAVLARDRQRGGDVVDASSARSRRPASTW